jgi:hypothetical protein
MEPMVVAPPPALLGGGIGHPDLASGVACFVGGRGHPGPATPDGYFRGDRPPMGFLLLHFLIIWFSFYFLFLKMWGIFSNFD